MKFTSRQRPLILLKTLEIYLSLGTNLNDMLWLFTFDVDDELCWNTTYFNRINELFIKYKVDVNKVEIVGGVSKNKIHAINRMSERITEWDILLNISDDQRPIIKGYDDLIRKSMPDSLDKSLWFNDGWQDRINTMECLGKVFYDNQKYIYHPEFKSFFCDNLATVIGLKNGTILKFHQCLIRHDHYGWNPNSDIKKDALYERNDKDWKHDEDLYKQLSK